MLWTIWRTWYSIKHGCQMTIGLFSRATEARTHDHIGQIWHGPKCSMVSAIKALPKKMGKIGVFELHLDFGLRTFSWNDDLKLKHFLDSCSLFWRFCGDFAAILRRFCGHFTQSYGWIHAKTFRNVFTDFIQKNEKILQKKAKKKKKEWLVRPLSDSNPRRWLGRSYCLPRLASCPDALAGYATKSLEINSGFLPSYSLVKILANRKAVTFTFQPKKYKFQFYP